MIGCNAEALISTVICAQFFKTDGFVSVDFAENAGCACIPPVWVLRLFLNVAACFGDGCPCCWLDLVDVFFEVFC